MSEEVCRGIFLASALLVWPAVYVAFCLRLRRERKRSWIDYAAYFVLFGEAGGWLLALAVSPSGLTAASIIFLMTFGLVGCVCAFFVLAAHSS